MHRSGVERSAGARFSFVVDPKSGLLRVIDEPIDEATRVGIRVYGLRLFHAGRQEFTGWVRYADRYADTVLPALYRSTWSTW